MERRNASICTTLVGLLSLFCYPSVAAADWQNQQGSGFVVTPQFWYSSVDPLVGAVGVTEAYFVPSFGAKLSYRLSSAPNYTFQMSGVWGEGSGDAVIAGVSLATTLNDIPFHMSSSVSPGESEGKRSDMEFLIRRTYPDKWYSLHLGVRYASWKEITAFRIGYVVSVGPVPIINQTYSDEQSAALAADLKSDYIGLEMGFGTMSQMTHNGRHCLLTDFTLAVARCSWETTLEVSQNLVPAATLLELLGLPDSELSGNHLAVGLDVAAGYQYQGDRVGLSLSYKVLVLFEKNVPQLTAVSGPQMGLSVAF